MAVLHNESRRSVNALHRAIGREAGGDMLPDGPEMKRIFSGAGFHDVAILEGDDRYALRACKPVLRDGRADVSDTSFGIGLHDRNSREATTSVEA